MRAGVHRLAAIVEAEFGEEAADGTLFVFVSRDRTKAKLLRHGGNGWVLWYLYLTSGAFRCAAPGGARMLPFSATELALMAAEPSPRRPSARSIL